jgi:chemotaxis signal transduction protein
MTGPEVQQRARTASTHQLVIFALGGEDYALPIALLVRANGTVRGRRGRTV